jgi:hypothetical protein
MRMAPDEYIISIAVIYYVCAHALSVAIEKRDALQSWPAPISQHEVRSLQGTFGFWGDYILMYTTIVATLTNLTCKTVAWS